jgi:hypothetical protein
MSMTTQAELQYRPQSYFWPVAPAKHAAGRIQGAQRRWMVQVGLLRADTPLYRPTLDAPQRAALGRLHPSLMGGEYLPASKDAEVEIARIEIKSTTYDVTTMNARPGSSRIHYRVVDEYEGETLSGVTRRT